ncbi:MAG: tRNA (5-methylaminomethyl-2-thiouridine)(34)-methyltransferase MnmD [Reichenbachiella sp.]
MPKVNLIETRDGSSSLYLPEMDETYHSTHGALTESQYVFVEKGLEHFVELYPEKSKIRILEIGFGTGLNPWLTAMKVGKSTFSMQYCSLEKYPLNPSVIEQLNYKNEYAQKDQELFEKIHDCPWEKPAKLLDGFSLEKKEIDLFDYHPSNSSFDIIYFDAFAPSKQPEMWSIDVLSKMYNALTIGGVFITYCAQGQFKRDLKSVGFKCEELPGPPGKKEMTRGVKH